MLISNAFSGYSIIREFCHFLRVFSPTNAEQLEENIHSTMQLSKSGPPF
jgi:hypothetical protein